MPITIGYYDDGEHRAGTGRYLVEVIGGLDRRKFSPVFFAPKPRAWHIDLRELPIEIVYPAGTAGQAIGSLSAPPPVGDKPAAGAETARRAAGRLRLPAGIAWSVGLLREIQAAKALFAQRPIDLLHSNNTGAEPAPLAAKRAGIPRIVGTLHVLPSYDLHNQRNGRHFRWLENASMKALHQIIGCCDAACREWQARCGFDDAKMLTIHNGIDPNRVTRTQSKKVARSVANLPSEAFLIGAVGNLHEYKGYEFLLRAMPLLRAKVPNAHLVVAGTGSLETELKALAQSLNISEYVTFLGFCSDIRSVLESLDVYTQASLVEAFPMAILEAGAMGLPIVATAVGGVPEAILEGKTGLLVPAKDPQALANAYTSMAQNPARRAQMGEAGQCRVRQHFTRDQMVAKTIEVYEKMMA